MSESGDPEDPLDETQLRAFHLDGLEQSEPDPIVARGEANVAASLAAFETFRDDLNALLCEVRAGETGRAKKLAPVVSELARAVSRIADEWVRLDGLLLRMGSRGQGNAEISLDLAAARAEVCRRLAERRAGRN